MQSGSKHIAILGMAAALAGISQGTKIDVVPNYERARKYYDPSSGRKGQVGNKTARGKRRRAIRGRR